MTRLRLVLCAITMTCAATFSGCGDDDDDGSGSDDAGLDGGAGRGGTGGRAGTGGRGGAGGAVDEDAGDLLDAGDDDGGADDERVASALVTAFGGADGLIGLAEFTQSGSEVTLVIVLDECPDGDHTVVIHAGGSCADTNAIGVTFDGVRGEGIPAITCADNEGSLVYTRESVPAETAWSVDGDVETDIVGRALVIHDEGGDPVACGVIELD